MDWVYGVKAGDFSVDPSRVKSLVNRYGECGNIPIILGCTELPLLAERLNMRNKFIDPVAILARRCIVISETEN